jgi:hypothetical protein
MEWAICQCASENIDEALNLALNYEAFKMSRNRKYANTQHVRQQQEVGDHGSQNLYAIGEHSQTQVSRSDRNDAKKCFYCGKPGHFKNKCRKRQFDIQSGKLNVSSHRPNFVEKSESSEKSRECARDSLNDPRLSL